MIFQKKQNSDFKNLYHPISQWRSARRFYIFKISLYKSFSHVGAILALLAMMYSVFVPGLQKTFAATGINKQISYQGRLIDASGIVVVDGNYDIVFKLYTQASGGSPVWTGNYTVANGNPIVTNKGIFSVLLGSGTGNVLNIDFSQDTYYLGVTIGTDSEMTPRKRIGSTPQSINSNNLIGDGYIKLTGTPTGSNVDQGTVYINPTSATSGQTLMGLVVNGTQKFKVDEAGNIAAAGDLALNGGDINSSGALTITPNAGSNLNIALSTTGDFAVNTNQLYVDTSTGNVGIGNNATASKLQISSNNGSSLFRVERIDTNDYMDLDFLGGSSNLGFSSPLNITVQDGAVETPVFSYVSSTNVLELSTGGVARQTINSTGYIGIGTTNPGELLSLGAAGTKAGVLSLAGATSGKAIIQVSAVAGTPTLTLPTATGTIALTSSNITGTSAGLTAQYIDWNSASGGNSIANKPTLGSLAALSSINNGNWSGTQLVVGNGGTGTTTQFTPGSMVFAGASGVYSQDNTNLFWDDTNNRLGIGTVSPGANLQLGSDTLADKVVTRFSNLGGYSDIGIARNNDDILMGSINADLVISNHEARSLILGTNNLERMRINSSGSVGIGTINPLEKLHIASGNVQLSNDFGILFRDFADTESLGIKADVNDNLTFRTGGAWDRMVINSLGNVGIGTNDPSTMLQISGTNNKMRLSYNTSNYSDVYTTSSGLLAMDSSNNTESAAIIGTGAAQDASIQFDGSAQDYYFGVDDTDGYLKMGAGMVVGTTPVAQISPTAFQIVGGQSLTMLSGNGTFSQTYTGTATPHIIYANSVTTGNVLTLSSSSTALTSTANGLNVAISGTLANSGITRRGVYSSVTTTNATSGSNYGGYFSAGSATTANYGVYGVASGAGITNYGGYFTASGGTNNYGLYVNAGTSYFAGSVGVGIVNPGTYKMYINGTGYLNSAAWTYGSDRRLKENILSMNYGLDKIMQLIPQRFDYIEGEKDNLGFIAQDVQMVLPELVKTQENGMLGLKTEMMIPVMIKAIQEQQGEILDIQTQNGDLVLKTNSNINTVQQLQNSIDTQLGIVQTSLISLDVKNSQNGEEITNHEIRISNLETLTQTMQAQIAELQQNTNQEFLLSLDQKLSAISEFIAITNGTFDLIGGGLKAQEVEAKKLSITNDQNSINDDTIGEGVICPEMRSVDENGECTIEQIDANNDGIDDITGEEVSNGKKVFVKTMAAQKGKSKVFITLRDIVDESLAVTEIKDKEGFLVEVKNVLNNAVHFDWWIVEVKQ